MIKRMNKITSLLVAAAAVASIIPATGVSAVDYQKIDSQEGTIYEAVAYKDGSFYIDGNTKDGDAEAAYYLNSGDYTELDNVDTGATVTGTFGENYLNVDNGDYYVDLNTGSVTDEDLSENNSDDAATALRKSLRDDNDGRYTDTDVDGIHTLTELEGARFSKTWYEASYTTSAGATVSVYTDAEGNYIDGDYNVGKIKIKDASNHSATLENTVDGVDFASNEDATIQVSNSRVVAQDSNYIYRLVDITINAVGVTEVNGQTADGTTTISNDGTKVSYKAIQKISKAQSTDDVDGAKYAKTVTTYALTDEEAKTVDGNDLITDTNTKFEVVSGKLIAYNIETAGTVVARSIALTTSAGYAYTDVADETSEDAVDIDTDADGNLWRLDGGYIYEFDNDQDWNKVYKVDGSMEEFSVYDKDNMVIWNEDDEVYSIVDNTTADETTTTDTTTDTTTETPEIITGWVQAKDGTWTYNKADGTKATSWIQDGSWYFLKADGVMATGWVKDGSTWYYLNGSGAMKTGWVNDNGSWYYLAGSGAMKTGWINDNGTWYYCNASGAMLSNTTVDGYNLNSNGAWIR
jgi:glucan-binding YG repeat protein